MNTHAPVFEAVSRQEVAWLGTDPIPAAAYYDPAWFELEREAVFRRNWLHVGHVCELPEPNSFIRRELEVLRASIIIARGKDGQLRAFHNVCTHRGTQLVSAQSGKQSTFSCPYHMWTFGTDGSLLSAPDFERFYVDKAQCALPQVAVEECAGLIFVHFGKPEQGLREWLGPIAEQLDKLPVSRATTYSEYTYEIDANWKLTYDNFQENYHLRFIHPRTGGAACAAQNPFGYPTAYAFHGPHRTQTIWSNPDAGPPSKVQASAYKRLGACAMKLWPEALAMSQQYLAIFPNVFLFGSPVQHFLHTVFPISAEKSRGVIRLYWVGEDANASERFAREYSMGIARDIHTEDRSVIEAGQRGLSSGALQHIHFQEQESLCRHLFNSVDAMVQAYKAEVEAQGVLK